LLQGNHAEIDLWRMKQSLKRTYERRPDLINEIDLTDEERRILEEIKNK